MSQLICFWIIKGWLWPCFHHDVWLSVNWFTLGNLDTWDEYYRVGQGGASQTLLFRRGSTNQHHWHHLVLFKNERSQVLPQIYWIRLCILTRAAVLWVWEALFWTKPHPSESSGSCQRHRQAYKDSISHGVKRRSNGQWAHWRNEAEDNNHLYGGKALDHSQGQNQRILTTCRESSPYQLGGSGHLSGTAHLSK